MQTWIWIVIALVVVLAAALAVGLVRARHRRISLTEAPKPVAPATPEGEKPRGGYKAGGSISFSPGSGTAVAPKPKTPTPPPVPAHPAGERTETDGEPGIGEDAAVPRDEVRRDLVDVELPSGETISVPDDLSTLEEIADDVETTAHPAAPADDLGTVAPPSAEPKPVPDLETFRPQTEVTAEPPLEAVPTAPALAPAAVDQIEPTAGRLSRLRGRLARSQSTFGRSLLGLLGAGTLDEDSWTEVEDTLLMADLGAQSAADLTARLREAVARHGVTDATSARTMLRSVLVDAVGPDLDRSVRALPHDGRPSVLLVVGVNGTGKTTTTGKLARVLVAEGRTVVLGAADTFRAAAADQLATWAERAGAHVVRSGQGADPASVAFDAVKRGIDENVDAVLIDTAGRLHTKTGLMDELGKVKRVVEKLAAVDEVLLVIDATTGQNGLVQAKVFAEVVDVTGIVLTKLDGTAKGGIVIAVQRALGVPVKLVGLGEGADDLAPFEPGAFVDAVLG